jgi:hypothetical protein
MSTYQERQVKAARKKRRQAMAGKKRTKIGPSKVLSIPTYETPSFGWKSLDTRVAMAPRRDPLKSTQHTIAPAYNKGAYQVISKDCIKDIGR